MADICTDTSDDVKNEGGLRYRSTEFRESIEMVGVEFDSTFGTQSWREDSVLVVEEKRIYVSRSVLSLLSPVFTQMFEKKIKDSGPMEIQLEGKKHDDMIEFLQCIYPNIMAEVTIENVFVVLPLAVEFLIGTLKERCEDLLLNYADECTELEFICEYLGKAFEFSLPRLQRLCIDIASDRDYSHLEDAEKEFPLPVTVKLEIQGKMIEKMKLQILEDKMSMEAVKLKDLLVGCINVPKLKNPHVGYLEYTFSEFNKMALHCSSTTTVHGITWCIQVATTKPEYLGLYLQANQSDGQPKFKCRAGATLRLINYKNDEGSISKTTDNIYTATQSCWGYINFAEIREVMDPNEGFIKDGKVQIDISILVEEPTFE